jgi:hypothetical protein
MATGTTCELYVDDGRMNDGRPGENPLDPVALSGLQVQWGRDTTVDQPQSSSCTFEVMDPPGGGSFARTLSTGRRVAVTATAEVWTPPGHDGTFLDPYINHPWPGGIFADINTNLGPLGLGGVGTLAFYPRTDFGRAFSFMLAPKVWSFPFPDDPSNWDEIPTTRVGQRWTWTIRLAAPPGAVVTAAPVLFTGPWTVAGTPVTSVAVTHTGTGDFVDLGGTWTPGVDGRWVGLWVSVFPSGPRWADFVGDAPVVTRRNLVRNPSMATTSLGWNYVASNVGSIGWVPDGIDAGAVRFTCTVGFPGTATGNQFAGSALSTSAADLVEGTAYTFSLYVRPTRTVGIIGAPNWRNAAGSEIGSSVGPVVVCPAGQWTRVSAVATAIPGTAYGGLRLRLAQGYSLAPGDLVDYDHALIEAGEDVGPYFDGDTPGATWTGVSHGSASELATGGGARWSELDPWWTWQRYSTVRVSHVDAYAPASGGSHTALVFAGRITDVEASFDTAAQAPVIKVTAVDFTADLDNRDVGDEPWDVEPMATRFNRILGLAGLPIVADIDPTVGAREVTWRDVDRQAATGLLRDLATSVDAVLWPATHATLGAYLRVEDASQRPALYRLAMTDGLVQIGAGSGVRVSSCEILRDPISFVENVSDVATRTAVSWLEQGIDDEGKHTTTEHTVESVDVPLEAVLGVRRVQVSTQLVDHDEAEAMATRLLARVISTEWRAQGVAIDDDDIDDASLMLAMLDGTTRIGMPFLITDLPDWSPIPDRVAVYAEGGSLRFDDGRWIVDLNISRGFGVGHSVTWAELPAAWRWVDFDPDVAWIDLEGVAGPSGGTP